VVSFAATIVFVVIVAILTVTFVFKASFTAAKDLLIAIVFVLIKSMPLTVVSTALETYKEMRKVIVLSVSTKFTLDFVSFVRVKCHQLPQN